MVYFIIESKIIWRENKNLIAWIYIQFVNYLTAFYIKSHKKMNAESDSSDEASKPNQSPNPITLSP